MKGSLATLASFSMLASHATADFGVWRIQDQDAFGNNAAHPLLTDGSVQSGDDVYNWWKTVSHCGKKFTFTGLPDGPGKDACGQLFGIHCDYSVTDETGAQIGGCEFGGHALSFVENLAGVAIHLDGFRSLWCTSQQFTPTHG
ncbi:hypothetical protein ACJZ2D_016857 [Fusarium nematophilum]